MAAAYSLLLASLVLVASNPRLWAMRKRIALYGFVIFTLLTLMVHSAAFERAKAAETLGTQGVTQLVRGIVASYAGVVPSDVDTSVEIREGVWIVYARVSVSVSRLRSGAVMTPKIVSAAEMALEQALGVEVDLRVEYRVVP